jgi:hypothetical protein
MVEHRPVSLSRVPRKGAKANKKRRKQHRQEATTDGDNGINEREGSSSANQNIEATENSKRQAQLPKDHFEKLLEKTCPNHSYAVKHKLRDCNLMKSFMNMGSL